MEERALNAGVPLPDGDYPALIKRFFRSRKIVESKSILDLLNPKLSALKSPDLLYGMSSAVEILTDSFIKKEKICIYADFDLDGTSGLALLYEGFKDLGYTDISYYQPKRLSEGYGFHKSAVEDLAKQGMQVIITVDVGITANDTVRLARELGMKVILTDHHMPSSELPEADVIINPNSPQCTSALNYLCGAGVGFYLLRALASALADKNLINREKIDLKKYLDFFTIGTLTDLVPLIGDNRILVKYGLKQLEITERPGLKVLAEALNLRGRTLSSSDIAIRFAPKLNALSRMENGILPVDLFLVQDEENAHKMVKSVLHNNETRVNEQQNGEKIAEELLSQWSTKEFVFLHSPQFHRGVIGLIATKLSQRFNCPAFVGSENEDGSVVGSSRVPFAGGTSVLQALDSVAPFLNRYGGHHQAAGFEFAVKNSQNIVLELQKFYCETNQERTPICFEYDFELFLQDCQSSLMKWLDSIGPFGQGFPTPQFLLRKMKIKSIYDLKGGHLKFHFVDNPGQGILEALFFSPPPYLIKPAISDLVDVVGELQWNFHAGHAKLQFLVRDLKMHSNLLSSESVS